MSSVSPKRLTIVVDESQSVSGLLLAPEVGDDPGRRPSFDVPARSERTDKQAQARTELLDVLVGWFDRVAVE